MGVISSLDGSLLPLISGPGFGRYSSHLTGQAYAHDPRQEDGSVWVSIRIGDNGRNGAKPVSSRDNDAIVADSRCTPQRQTETPPELGYAPLGWKTPLRMLDPERLRDGASS
jgi:hypothetical protein